MPHTNFKLIGQTAESKHIFWKGKRYHPRSLTIDRPYSKRLNEAVSDGSAVIQQGQAKNVYAYYFNKEVT